MVGRSRPGRRRREPVRNLWHGVALAVALIACFFVLPIGYTAGLSLTSPEIEGLTLANYETFFSTEHLTGALGRTLALSVTVVLITSVVAYPLSYFLVFLTGPRLRMFLLFVLVAPFWTSFMIRAFAWQLVLSDSGVIAYYLTKLLGSPVAFGFLYTIGASIFGLTLFGVMLMTLTLFSVMVTIDPRLLEANAALGGTRWRGFLEVVLPLSAPGWLIGGLLTFIVCVGDYAVPSLLGGGLKPVLAQIMLSTLKGTYDVAMAATLAVILVIVIVIGAIPFLLLVRQVRLQT